MKRDARTLGAGLAGTLGVLLLFRGVSDPGLRGTLAVLPIVAALLAILARRLGAPPRRGPELWLGAVWLAVALGTDALGMSGAARLVAGGFVLLVAWRGAALLPAMRRWGTRFADRTWPFALLPFTLGLACLPWSHAAAPPTGDEPYFLLLAESLASDFDLDLENQYRLGVAERFTSRPIAPQVELGRGGERFSRHGALLPLLLVPFWKAGGAFGARLALVVCWSLVAERLFRLALAARVRPRGAFRAWGIATFALPLLPYSRAIWIELPAALAAAFALESWLRIRASSGRPSTAEVARLVVAIAALPLLKLRLLAIAAPLAGVTASGWPRPDRRRWWATGTAFAITLGLLAANLLRYAQPLGAQEVGGLSLLDASPQHYFVALVGLFFDSGFGLLPLAPLWILALLGAVALWRRERSWRWAWVAVLPYLALVLRRDEWYGGWCPPFRYLVVLLPWLTVALGVALERPLPRAGRRLAAVALIVTAAAAWAVTLEPTWATSLAAGRSDLLDVLAAPFASDLARFAPSAVRPRLATALAPVIAIVALIALARGRRRATPALIPLAAATVLLGAAGWIVAAGSLPTRIAEAEDPWIEHHEGDLYPPRWTPDRTRFDGGWILPPGARLALRPIPGGGTAELRVRWRSLGRPRGASQLTLRVGGDLVQRWAIEAGEGWRIDRLTGVAWKPGATLELRASNAGPTPGAPVVIDRLEFRWR